MRQDSEWQTKILMLRRAGLAYALYCAASARLASDVKLNFVSRSKHKPHEDAVFYLSVLKHGLPNFYLD
ncbi:hypothetical protein DK843_18255 [Chromobacterium phragmitis]|uniref:Uncharacterized protein n=1 Tax=Chromobacterium phragmitis TaxID=2202141 RepID=A0A344ULC1_9NEIS|nr:hypothetical protein DK843_18255 [Chromobacterium phragmitis]